MYNIRTLVDGEIYNERRIEAEYEHTAERLFTSTVDLLRRTDPIYDGCETTVQMIEPGGDVRHETTL